MKNVRIVFYANTVKTNDFNDVVVYMLEIV